MYLQNICLIKGQNPEYMSKLYFSHIRLAENKSKITSSVCQEDKEEPLSNGSVNESSFPADNLAKLIAIKDKKLEFSFQNK